MSLQEPEQPEIKVTVHGQRRVKGKWAPGQSGNPEGRQSASKKRYELDVQALARQKTRPAIKALADIVQDTECPPAARVSAATAILERGWGKPKQEVEVKGRLEQHVLHLVASLDAVIAQPEPEAIEHGEQPRLPARGD